MISSLVTLDDDRVVNNICGVGDAIVNGNYRGAEDVGGINDVSGVIDACVGIDSINGSGVSSGVGN